MSHTRVIPRDFFNESKLLKCLGQLSLLIHEGRGIRWPLRLQHDDAGFPGFLIELEPTGNLVCANVTLLCGETAIGIGTTYNSKAAYPLNYATEDGGENDVFDDDGTFTADFTAYLDTLTESDE
jgi:hypothetical protein